MTGRRVVSTAYTININGCIFVLAYSPNCVLDDLAFIAESLKPGGYVACSITECLDYEALGGYDYKRYTWHYSLPE